MVDQRRKKNQPRDFLDAQAAAQLLGVKLRTLYAYASRGLVTSVPSGASRQKLYARSDLLRLAARSRARAGHGAVAAGALSWGEPVLESAITGIGPDGPAYRGHLIRTLAFEDISFERVAELLWTSSLPDAVDASRWQVELGLDPKLFAQLASRASPVDCLALAVPQLALLDPERFLISDEPARARRLLRRLALAVAAARGRRNLARAERAASQAEAVLCALGHAADARAERAVNRVLVVCADHELNVSTFAVRVAASAGADLYACVSTGLGAFAGPRHGAACDRVEALVAEIGSPRRAAAGIRRRARRGEAIAGFGHPLYAAGDPRVPPLLDAAETLGDRTELATLRAILSAMERAEQPPPTLDAGLVAVSLALGLPPGSASLLFGLGRIAGWVAHALEQRASGALLRPRARYTGP